MSCNLPCEIVVCSSAVVVTVVGKDSVVDFCMASVDWVVSDGCVVVDWAVVGKDSVVDFCMASVDWVVSDGCVVVDWALGRKVV